MATENDVQTAANRFIFAITDIGRGSSVHTWPSSTKRGYPVGCATPSDAQAPASSPLSVKPTSGSMVYEYTARERVKTPTAKRRRIIPVLNSEKTMAQNNSERGRFHLQGAVLQRGHNSLLQATARTTLQIRPADRMLRLYPDRWSYESSHVLRLRAER